MELKGLHMSESSNQDKNMYEPKNMYLYEKQKAMLEQFLKTGAIDKAQYEKSLSGLKEKMEVYK